MDKPSKNPPTQPPAQDKPDSSAVAKPAPAQKSSYQSLSSIRDYLTVQMEQDSSWHRYPDRF